MGRADDRRARWGEAGLAALVLGMILLAPCAAWPESGAVSRLGLGLAVAAAGLLALVLVACFSWTREAARRVLQHGPNLPVAIFLAYSALSLAWSPYRAYG